MKDELGTFQKKQELLESEDYTAMEELTARVELVANSLTDAIKVPDPKVLDSLKLTAKETKRDPNQALETAKTRDRIDDKFDRAARRLKDLEQATGQSGPRLDSGPLSDEAPQDPTEKDTLDQNGNSKMRSSEYSAIWGSTGGLEGKETKWV